jgi:hypothetical protein
VDERKVTSHESVEHCAATRSVRMGSGGATDSSPVQGKAGMAAVWSPFQNVSAIVEQASVEEKGRVIS